MCGIFGILSSKNENYLKQIVRIGSNSLKHRGPDGHGEFIADSIGMAHRRLSIIDLGLGKQPMFNETQNLCIVFNGEITNHSLLRKQMEFEGEDFKTNNSDTEVLLKLYEKEGQECLKRINGFFSFAIWNKKKKELFIARDHLGIKPLYYSRYNNEIIFSSEVKSIIKIFKYLKKDIVLNKNLFNEYLVFGNIAGTRTLYKDIYELEAGTSILIKDNKIIKKKYWNNFIHLNLYKNKNILEYVEENISNIFKEWTASDVNVGMLLSSGIDSNLLYKILSIIKKPEIFTAKFENNNNLIDEDVILADEYKVNLKKKNVILIKNKSIKDRLLNISKRMDFPLQNFNSMTFMAICEHIKKTFGPKVIFTGDGADEIFGGYERYFHISEKFFKYNNKVDLIFSHNISALPRIKLFTKINKNDFKERYKIFDRLKSKSVINKLIEYDQLTFLKGYLSRADEIGMMFGLEIRSPYLDHRLVNIMNALDSKYKILKMKQGKVIYKYLLRLICEKYLPNKMIWKKEKIKFNFPTCNAFYSGVYKDMYNQLITKDSNVSKYFDLKGLKKLLDLHKNEFESQNDHSNTLSRILSLELWLRKNSK
jgi:asparagine synthase (glutamine-hydrolysing)